MIKKYIVLMIFSLATQISFCQGQNDKWCFGWWAGVDFSSGAPKPYGDSIMTYEGSTSVSDAKGNLLFYSDGVKVWNRKHEVMSKTTLSAGRLLGSVYSTQSAVAVPHPDSSNLHFLFTTFSNGDSARFAYSIVDMNLDNGYGDISSTKNVGLLSSSCEKIAVVKHANGHDYWVIAHEWRSDAFYSYLITSAGLDTTPVITHVGDTITSNGTIYNKFVKGYMKVSYDGTKLVMVTSPYLVHFFDFDAQTGRPSNAFKWYTTGIPSKALGAYGAEFSPNSQYLYVSTYNYVYPGHYPGYVVQFDLKAGSPSEIQASAYIIGSGFNFCALQLAPDHKIYLISDTSSSVNLHVINNPNAQGALADFQLNAYNYREPGNVRGWYGLPYFYHPYLNVGIKSQLACNIPQASFELTNTHMDSVRWYFGDTASGINNTSTLNNPTHTYPAFGVYAVTAIAYAVGMVDTTTSLINIAPPEAVTLRSDTSVCHGNSVVLSAPMGYTYKWNNNQTTQDINVTQSGNYKVTVSNFNCSVTSSSVTITVNPNPSATITALGSVTFCEGDSVNLSAPAGMRYRWNNNDTTQVRAAYYTGNYYVTVTDANNCSAASTVMHVTSNPKPQPGITYNGNDTICQGKSLQLYPSIAGSGYQWSNNSTNATIFVNQTGEYTLTVFNSYGCSAASAAVVITVVPNPIALIKIDSNARYCEGDTIILEASSANTYKWSNNMLTQQIFVHQQGFYSVTVTDMNNCSAKADTTIYINALPMVTLSGNDDTICNDADLKILTGGSPNNGFFSGTGVVNGKFDAGLAGLGMHEIVYTYTDANQCANYAVENILVSICTQISSINEDYQINVYPNPVTSVLEIYTSMPKGEIHIYSPTGILLKTQQITAGHSIIDVASFATGMFIFEVKSEDAAHRVKCIKM